MRSGTRTLEVVCNELLRFVEVSVFSRHDRMSCGCIACVCVCDTGILALTEHPKRCVREPSRGPSCQERLFWVSTACLDRVDAVWLFVTSS